MTRGRATAIGFGAVLLWSLLALFTVGSAPVPPLLLNAITFAIGGALGVVWTIASGSAGQLRSVRPAVYLFGTAALFGYHFLYFSALRLAPPAEASLIAYLLSPGAGFVTGALVPVTGGIEILSPISAIAKGA